MRFLQINIVVILACLLPAIAQGANTKQDSISAALLNMMEMYPESTLIDIYKSAFQNRFGPGHIIADSSKAKAYLDWELEQPQLHENAQYEPTLYDGSYVRVNLSIITDSIVSYDTFFEAFIESANTFMPSIENWAQEWHQILVVVEDLYPDLPNMTEDKASIDERLNQGIYQGHHSDAYSRAYDPHYRIMRRDIFDARIKPLLH